MLSTDATLNVMAFDYGKQRIGVAVGQTVSRTAAALETVRANDGNPQWRDITRLVDEWLPDLFVVGVPGHEDRHEHPLSEEIERFARRLNGRYKRPVEFVDERLSSFAAAGEARSSGSGLDAGAAKMILMTWLEQTLTRKSAANQ